MFVDVAKIFIKAGDGGIGRFSHLNMLGDENHIVVAAGSATKQSEENQRYVENTVFHRVRNQILRLLCSCVPASDSCESHRSAGRGGCSPRE